MNLILSYDWLLEWSRWGCLACLGLSAVFCKWCGLHVCHIINPSMTTLIINISSHLDLILGYSDTKVIHIGPMGCKVKGLERSSGRCGSIHGMGLEEQWDWEREEVQLVLLTCTLTNIWLFQLAYVEDLNGPWLFDSMYADDPEASKLAALPGMVELLDTYPSLCAFN